MNEMFGFDLPGDSDDLSHREYVNLVNRIRGNFLSYVAYLDDVLTQIITGYFLRDQKDLVLWSKTVFDEDRTAFGSKIIWLARIIKNSPELDRFEGSRTDIQSRLDKIRMIRNDLAHDYTQNKQVELEDIKSRVIRLYDYEEGKDELKLLRMRDIMRTLNDAQLLDQLNQIKSAVRGIRGE